jgi:adenylate cyclase
VLTQLLRNRNEVSETTADDAIAASRRAIELAPDLAEAHGASGTALQLAQRYAEAKAAFERALELDPRHFHAHYWFEKYGASRGDHAQAVLHYERAFEIQPDDYRPVTLALQEYQALNDKTGEQSSLRRSWQAIERHLAIDPDDSYANDHAAGVLMLLGRREEAMRILNRALTLRPDDYRTLYTAACTASLGGMYEQALDFLDRAVGTGRGQLEWILNDNDLAPLRDSPRFAAIVARLR